MLKRNSLNNSEPNTEDILLKLFIVISILISFFLIANFELAHDEAYYWLYSQKLAWGYFDHPPFVAWIIRFFSFLPDHEFSVRIGFLIMQLASIGALLQLTKEKTWVILLFFSFPLASFAGLLALPDGPLLFMTSLYCLWLKKFLNHKTMLNSIILGGIIALLLYSKYHGILVVLLTLIAVPNIILSRYFYIVFGVAFLCFLPHLFWQYQHDFITLQYHFFERPKSGFSLKNIFEYLAIQLILSGFLFSPVIWKSLIQTKVTDPFLRSMKFIVLGSFVFFFISTMSKKFEANWIIYTSIPMIIFYANTSKNISYRGKLSLISSFVIIFLIKFIFIIDPKLSGIRRLKEFSGWQDWALKVQQECPSSLIWANTYQLASKLSFYLKENVSSLNFDSRKNQFDLWNQSFFVNQSKKISQINICYITDKKNLFSDRESQRIVSPDGKKWRLVKNLSEKDIWEVQFKKGMK